MRRAAALAAAVAAGVLLAGCAGGLSDEGDPLTSEQAELLSQTRFRLGEADAFGVEISVGAPGDAAHYVIDATVSHADGRSWGTLERGPEGLAVEERIAFDPASAVIDDGSGWRQEALAGGAYEPVVVVFSLVTDRPENSELLRQSDARFLGRTDLDGDDAQVFRLPTNDGSGGASRMWVDDDGDMRRIDNGGDEFVVMIGEAGTDAFPVELDGALGSGAE